MYLTLYTLSGREEVEAAAAALETAAWVPAAEPKTVYTNVPERVSGEEGVTVKER